MKILLIRNDKMGDFTLSIPTIIAIKKMIPAAKVYVLVSKLAKDLAREISYIDGIMIDDNMSIRQLALYIRSMDFTVSISLFSTLRTAFVLKMSNIRYRIAPRTKIAQIFYNYTKWQRRSRSIMPEWSYNLDLLSKLHELLLKSKLKIEHTITKKKFFIEDYYDCHTNLLWEEFDKIADEKIIYDPIESDNAQMDLHAITDHRTMSDNLKKHINISWISNKTNPNTIDNIDKLYLDNVYRGKFSENNDSLSNKPNHNINQYEEYYNKWLKNDVNSLEENLSLLSIFNEYKSRFIVLHPGSGTSAIDTNLSIDNYILLGKKLINRYHVTVIYHFGPGDHRLIDTFKMKIDFENAYLKITTGDTKKFLYFLKRNSIFISNSTGAAHMAGALNMYTITLFSHKKQAGKTRWQLLNQIDKQIHISVTTHDITYNSNKIIETIIMSCKQHLLSQIHNNRKNYRKNSNL